LGQNPHQDGCTGSIMAQAYVVLEALGELASEFGVHPVQIAQWKRQLLGASAGGFENVATSRRKPEQEQLVEQIYQHIAKAKVEINKLRKKGISRRSNYGR
jgi:transposase-like protein